MSSIANLRRIVVVAFCGSLLLQCRTVQPTTYTIDPSLAPPVASLPGLDGGPPRPVAVIAGPTGKRTEIVANEIILHPRSQQELNDFLAKYGATVVRDGTPFIVDPPASPPTPIGPSGWVLVRIDPSRSTLGDLQRNLATGPLVGQYRFSSEDSARVIALVAREKQLGVGPNLVMRPAAVKEHPDDNGGNLDASTWGWMTEDDDPATPGDQGLSTGVIHAWDYLRYQGMPPASGSFRPARIAIVDGGFAVDTTTGQPLNSNRDFGIGVRQIDLVDHDLIAGGTNLLDCGGFACPWHGQSVFGVAAAEPDNGYGGAGTGGAVVWPMLMRISEDLYSWADAIRSAAINGADVINVSGSGGCGDFHFFCSIPPDDIYDMHELAVNMAMAWGATVVAAAGNDGIDTASDDIIPCQLPHVACVGSVDSAGNNVFNYGNDVDIWAPTSIFSTVTPASFAQDANDVGPDEVAMFGGTSASTPFVAGVIALMKALEPGLAPGLFPPKVQEILQATVHRSTDPKVRTGWVDAFRAVQRVRPNQPPFVQFRGASATVPWTGVSLEAEVTDPELTPETEGRWPVRVAFSSDRDGALCMESSSPHRCWSGPLSLGEHRITATATDAFGASGSASRMITAINRPPAPRIREPLPSGTYYSQQPVTLAATVPDPDESIPPGAVWWSSDRDGLLGSGWSRDATLTTGTHVISVRATDMQGATGQDSVTITVLSGAGYPSVRILAPVRDDLLAPGKLFTLRGVATDPEDGPLTGARLVWSSSIDGVLGTGETLNVTLSGPPVPCNPEIIIHTLTLRATDSDGHSVEVKVRVTVGTVC